MPCLSLPERFLDALAAGDVLEAVDGSENLTRDAG